MLEIRSFPEQGRAPYSCAILRSMRPMNRACRRSHPERHSDSLVARMHRKYIVSYCPAT